MSLIESLKWRYATKKMNGAPVAEEKVDQIIAAAHLAPTSSGLQPFRIILITDPVLKEKIRPIAFGQSQVADSSHLLVFAAWDNYTEARIDKVFDQIVTERGLPPESVADYVGQLKETFLSRPAEENFAHTARQAYIAFAMAIAQAAELQVDATPMEGFDNAALDELLGLREKGLRSVTLLPLGYRDAENDWLVHMKKVRRPMGEFLMEMAG